MTVELLYLPNCPHYGAVLNLVRDVLKKHGIVANFTETLISSWEEAKECNFPGSPTLRVNGKDIEDLPAGELPVGFACRTYLVDGKLQGVPPSPWLERRVCGVQISELKCH